VVIQRCAHCDEALGESARFCPSCGVDVQAGLHCRSCSAKLPSGTKFCLNCGEAVKALLPGV
jgi:RNA polymerase subunit RPABC4/transcription elongation factor Spt4